MPPFSETAIVQLLIVLAIGLIFSTGLCLNLFVLGGRKMERSWRIASVSIFRTITPADHTSPFLVHFLTNDLNIVFCSQNGYLFFPEIFHSHCSITSEFSDQIMFLKEDIMLAKIPSAYWVASFRVLAS